MRTSGAMRAPEAGVTSPRRRTRSPAGLSMGSVAAALVEAVGLAAHLRGPDLLPLPFGDRRATSERPHGTRRMRRTSGAGFRSPARGRAPTT